MKPNKLLELLVVCLAFVGLLSLIGASQVLATAIFIIASALMLVLFAILSLGYLFIGTLVFLIYGAFTYLF